MTQRITDAAATSHCETLRRARRCIADLLASKPVRDADETLAEIDRAIDTAIAKEKL